MAAHESIYEYYLHQHRNIQYYLELCAINPEIELVHELRLCIKKLRAFHKLAEHLFVKDIDEHIHIKNRVRKLFKIAGRLRDTQVQIHMLMLLQEQTGIVYPEFRDWLLRREKKQISRFGKKPQQVVPQATAQSIHQKIIDLFASIDEETILTGTGKVLSELLVQVRELSTGSRNNRDLHRIRTITKRMKYIFNIMAHSYPDFKFNEVSVESLREIEAVAGQWHDNLVRVELLGRFIDTIKPADVSENFKYQELLNLCKSELNTSFTETSAVVRKALLHEVSDSE